MSFSCIDEQNNYYRYSFNLLRDHNLLKSSEEIFKYLNGNGVELLSQLELHIGYHCDLYRCPHCYGAGQNTLDGHLEINDYIRVLDYFKKYLSLIQISGVATEPLTNPIAKQLISKIKERSFGLGLHTKGYRLDDDTIELLTDDVANKESFITISLDSVKADEYVKAHNIDVNQVDEFNRNGKEYFDVVVKNIEKLYKRKIAKQSELKINLAFLLFNSNYSVNKVEKIIDSFANCCDVIRLSLPQANNKGSCEGELVEKRKVICFLQKKYSYNDKIKVLPFLDYHHNTIFQKCYAQKFQIVIDRAGNFFPCPQTALSDYSHLIYGNLLQNNLDGILLSDVRRELLSSNIASTMKCRICDRKDEDINKTIDIMLR